VVKGHNIKEDALSGSPVLWRGSFTNQYHSAQFYAKIKREFDCEGGRAMDFYTMVLRKSGNDWVALCLENGLVGQGMTKEESIRKLKEAIECFEDIRKTEQDVYSAPLSIKELHEFLTIEGKELTTQTFELRAVNA
jgi:predicted RNase H-like HicB family nuclease